MKAIIDGEHVTLGDRFKAHGGNAYRVLEGKKVVEVHTFPKGCYLSDMRGKTFTINGHKYTIL